MLLPITFAYMPSPLPRQVRWTLFARTVSIDVGLPSIHGGSAPALHVSRPAQRSLTLRPACSPSRPSDPLHRRLRRLRYLCRRSDCYRVERTSSRAGLSPAVDQRFSRRGCNRDVMSTPADAAREHHSPEPRTHSARLLVWNESSSPLNTRPSLKSKRDAYPEGCPRSSTNRLLLH